VFPAWAGVILDCKKPLTGKFRVPCVGRGDPASVCSRRVGR